MLQTKPLLILLLVLSIGAPVAAQNDAEDSPRVQPQVVRVAASDGLTLVGDYYALGGEGQPAVLLLHQLYTTRASWSPLINPLLDAGYSVLAVDLRGYGASGGRISWTRAVTDVQTWLDWLRAQPGIRADAVAVIGSSMGSNLALVGCANDSQCMTAVAISPGLNYYGIRPADSLGEGHSALLVYSRRDGYSGRSVPQMAEIASGDVQVQAYDGNVHGMDLFTTQGDTLIPLIVDWLNSHKPQ